MDSKKLSARIALIFCAVLVLLVAGLSLQNILGNESGQDDQPPTVSATPTPESRPSPDWRHGDPRPLAAEPDYSSLKSLAISLSYPLYEDGQETHPAAYTGGGSVDQDLASKPYREAKERANAIARGASSAQAPATTRNFADCGAFVATLVINFLDPHFPGLLVNRQLDYVEDPANGWKQVSVDGNYDPQALRTGDIFISTADAPSGHMWVWLGTVDGVKDVIAQAAYGPEGSSAYLPSLHRIPIQPGEADPQGRHYEVWRFTGTHR